MKIIIRLTPRLIVRKLQTHQVAKAIVQATGGAPACKGDDFIVRLRHGSNIIIVSTPHEATAATLMEIISLYFHGRSHPVKVYLSTPEGLLKGVVHGIDAGTGEAELMANLRVRTHGVRIVRARMLGQSQTALLHFEAPQVPRFVYYYGGEMPCRDYQQTRQFFSICSITGHRPDVCPNPTCALCGGAHLTAATEFNKLKRIPPRWKPASTTTPKTQRQPRPVTQSTKAADLRPRWFSSEREDSDYSESPSIYASRSGSNPRSRSRSCSRPRSHFRSPRRRSRSTPKQGQQAAPATAALEDKGLQQHHRKAKEASIKRTTTKEHEGWNDVGFHGSRQIPTPNMDALAAMGVILQRHYTTPVCTPSRSAFFTSLYPARTDLGYDVLTAAPKVAVPLTFEFLPQWLKRQGYSTHMVGKWHLGYKSLEYTPTWRGFDSFFGYYNGHEFYYNHTIEDQVLRGMLQDEGHCGLDLWRNVGHTTQAVTDLNGTYSTDAFTDEAKRIIADHDAEKPLFLYLAYQAVHAACKDCNVEAPPEIVDQYAYITAYNRSVFAAHSNIPTNIKPRSWTDCLTPPPHATNILLPVLIQHRRHSFCQLVAALPRRDCDASPPSWQARTRALVKALCALHVMDRSVGEVLAALQSRGMLADSVVVFASDNGGAPLSSQLVSNAGNNFPLRGAKEDVWEGGVRTPAVFWYGRRRGRLPRPPSQHVMHIVDWAPTFYAAAGGDVSDLGDVDGKNQWEALTERKCIDRGDVILEIEGRNEAAAIISGRYKLVNRSEGYCDALLDSRIPLPEGEPPEELDLDALMVSSEAWKALQEASADSGSRLHSAPRADWRREATVTCSADGADDLAVDDFDPCATVFVFDIFSDPCEINNLASSLPEVRDDLLGRLTTYRATILSPRPANNEADERGYPQYHNCTWSPWLDVEPSPRAECPC
ncbi:arylsulfatase B-like [Dermacentor andersoni]|uniref:arylsulfatase B-like n=1 Tax=Dermacentor andersoni TaxID=34620 RepID=UPI003B3ADAB6